MSEATLFQAAKCDRCGNRREGSYYNLLHIEGGMEALKCLFPDGHADEMNFVLFSTSGVHGSYVTIEELEASLLKYTDVPPTDADLKDDWCGDKLTVVIVQPRICCLRYGNIKVGLADMEYLKKLRASSWAAVQTIGGGK